MERIGQEAKRVLERSGGKEALALAGITAVWPAAVGDAVARHAWPLRLGRDGTLHVAASSSTWAFELDRLSPEILERLAHALGDVAPPRVRFRVGPVPEPERALKIAPGTTKSRPAATAETRAGAEAAASSIEDPELRGLVQRAAQASLARARSDRGF